MLTYAARMLTYAVADLLLLRRIRVCVCELGVRMYSSMRTHILQHADTYTFACGHIGLLQLCVYTTHIKQYEDARDVE